MCNIYVILNNINIYVLWLLVKCLNLNIIIKISMPPYTANRPFKQINYSRKVGETEEE